jgi:hypothetical protein
MESGEVMTPNLNPTMLGKQMMAKQQESEKQKAISITSTQKSSCYTKHGHFKE